LTQTRKKQNAERVRPSRMERWLRTPIAYQPPKCFSRKRSKPTSNSDDSRIDFRLWLTANKARSSFPNDGGCNLYWEGPWPTGDDCRTISLCVPDERSRSYLSGGHSNITSRSCRRRHVKRVLNTAPGLAGTFETTGHYFPEGWDAFAKMVAYNNGLGMS